MDILLHQNQSNRDYIDVTIKDTGITIDLGLYNKVKRRELAQKLREAADELMEGLE